MAGSPEQTMRDYDDGNVRADDPIPAAGRIVPKPVVEVIDNGSRPAATTYTASGGIVTDA
jgi:hypothetical protein